MWLFTEYVSRVPTRFGKMSGLFCANRRENNRETSHMKSIARSIYPAQHRIRLLVVTLWLLPLGAFAQEKHLDLHTTVLPNLPDAPFVRLNPLKPAPGARTSPRPQPMSLSTVKLIGCCWVAPPHDLVLASDVVDVSGTETDPVTAQVSYDPNATQAQFGGEEFMRLVSDNPVTHELLNAVAGNNGGTPNFIKHAHNAATDF